MQRPERQRDWLRLALQTMESSCEEALKAHDGSVDSAASSDDGRWIVTGSDDKTARVWDALGAVKPFVMKHPNAVTAVAMSRGEGRWIATGCADGAARVWEVRRPEEPLGVLSIGGSVKFVGFSAENDLVVVSESGSARLWRWPRSRGGESATNPLGEDRSIVGAALDEDGEHVLSATGDGRVRVFSTAPLRRKACEDLALLWRQRHLVAAGVVQRDLAQHGDGHGRRSGDGDGRLADHLVIVGTAARSRCGLGSGRHREVTGSGERPSGRGCRALPGALPPR